METRIRLRLETREPFADGLSFGDVGPYERLVGRMFFAVDPEAPAYRRAVSTVRRRFSPRCALQGLFRPRRIVCYHRIRRRGAKEIRSVDDASRDDQAPIDLLASCLSPGLPLER
jgi:hypothetical protein